MSVFGFIENFFFISLALVFVLVLLLVYHFKNRITIAEKKSESMYGLLTAVVKEIKTLRGMFGLGGVETPSPTSETVNSQQFEVQSKTTPEILSHLEESAVVPISNNIGSIGNDNNTHASGMQNGKEEVTVPVPVEVINLDFSKSDNKIVVSDAEDSDEEEEEDESDDESSISDDDDSDSDSDNSIYGSEEVRGFNGEEPQTVFTNFEKEDIKLDIFSRDVIVPEQAHIEVQELTDDDFIRENITEVLNEIVEEVQNLSDVNDGENTTEPVIRETNLAELTVGSIPERSHNGSESEATISESVDDSQNDDVVQDQQTNTLVGEDSQTSSTIMSSKVNAHSIDQLRKMNINQLKAIASQLGITSDISKTKKPELISIIQSHST
jgi:hypothetical protein